MDKIISDILEEIRSGVEVDPKRLAYIIHKHDKLLPKGQPHHAKKKLLPFYLKAKRDGGELWDSWNVDDDIERKLISILQVKPRRTASGVATITVITKPWPCRGECIFCPSDIRMPKSYLHGEPACQRAEKTFFDPYLQVALRLKALSEMGHPIDKIELIVLGGTWSDYPRQYQIWFVSEMMRALNDSQSQHQIRCEERFARYRDAGFLELEESLDEFASGIQSKIDDCEMSYSEGFQALYLNSCWSEVESWQTATLEELEELQRANESANHRAVGMVMETRPDAIDATSLTLMRRLGCTKVQVGIQSLDDRILSINARQIDEQAIARSIALLRLFGFKIHTHFMVNLYGSNPQADKDDYDKFVTDPRYLPDEVKLYPCVLVESSKLKRLYDEGKWVPYSHEQLVDILVHDTLATPRYTRISRMIRDISATDIVAGNKYANLRQLVEEAAAKESVEIQEIRSREISLDSPEVSELELQDFEYDTSVSTEHFLQWVDAGNRIAGFCRLSLPKADALESIEEPLPIGEGEAMIREVHVYGKVARLHEGGSAAQHSGLGKKLVSRACSIAKDGGYKSINVISSIGTREYYRNLGFEDNGLYQSKRLQ